MQRVLVMVVVLVLGCSKTNELPPEAWGVADYAKVDLRIDKPWTADDYTAAAQVLQQHTAGHRERLPRFRGQRSGAVFARLVAELPTDAGSSIRDRFGAHGQHYQAINAISKLYVENALATPSREWIELMGALLREAAVLSSSSGEFMASLGPDEATSEVRVGGIAKMKAAFGTMIVGGLLLADQQRIPADDRVAMLEHITATLPVLFPFTNPEAQRTIRETIARQVGTLPAGRLHDAIVATQQALPK